MLLQAHLLAEVGHPFLLLGLKLGESRAGRRGRAGACTAATIATTTANAGRRRTGSRTGRRACHGACHWADRSPRLDRRIGWSSLAACTFAAAEVGLCPGAVCRAIQLQLICIAELGYKAPLVASPGRRGLRAATHLARVKTCWQFSRIPLARKLFEESTGLIRRDLIKEGAPLLLEPLLKLGRLEKVVRLRDGLIAHICTWPSALLLPMVLLVLLVVLVLLLMLVAAARFFTLALLALVRLIVAA